MHIAIDATCLAWGWSGIPKYVDRIVREWVARESDIEITMLANTSQKQFSPIQGVNQIGVRRLGGGIWRNQFARAWVKREKPDVYWAPEMVLPRRVATRTVVTVHDLTPVTMAKSKTVRARLAFRPLRASVRRADRLIAVSSWSKRELIRVLGITSDRIVVIANGVDDQFTPGDRGQARANVRRRWGIDRPFVLAAGTLEQRKGLDVVFGAARAAAKTNAAWQLVLAGGVGDHGAAIAAEADTVPGCRRLGRVTDPELVDLYRAADVVATPSFAEGFGIVPLESMACGTPAVVSGGSGALEEISGPAAIVVPERSPAAWLAAIDEARSRRPELAQRGIQLAGRYRWPDTAAATLDALRGAAEDALRR